MKINFNLLRAFLPCKTSLFVNEYPKSGGTWLARMMSDVYDIPFRKSSERSLSGVGHGHYLHVAGGRPRVIIWRDPRDVIISYYHHVFFRGDGVSFGLKKIFERKMSKCENSLSGTSLREFSELIMKGGAYPRFGYEDFIRKFALADTICHTSYESLTQNAERELSRLTARFSMEFGLPNVSKSQISEAVEKNRFSVISGRETGTESKGSALRKGIVGDYKNYFSEPFLTEFETTYSEVLGKVRLRTEASAFR